MPDQGRFYEDFEIGERFVSDFRLVSADDVVRFADLTGDRNPIHSDPAFAARSEFGRLVAHGLLILSYLGGFFDETFDGTAVAFLGIESWRFVKPVFVGDFVRAEMTIGEKRLTRTPGRGILMRDIELFSQRGEIVQQGRLSLLIRTRVE